MAQYLAIQNTYVSMQLAIYKDKNVCASIELDKIKASKEGIIALQKLLKKCAIRFENLAFIVANQGPGPFTTLRVVISTINGLSFASNKPLIGINAIEAFLNEYQHKQYKNKVILLNAFGDDLYFGIQSDNSLDIGCGSIQSVLLQIEQKISENPILFLGNGIKRCQQMLQTTFGNRAHFLNPNPETVSLLQIAHMGLEKWQKQEDISFQLQPLYFKTAFFN
jgi:tRNA threonylcarbamoyladenosine biosynthesis protein TsaB